MGNSCVCCSSCSQGGQNDFQPRLLEQINGSGGNGGWLFPMYLVKVSDFLEMEGVPEPHHLLKQKNLLHMWQPGMFSIFVSHQWLGRDHPDPKGEQMALLRTVLRKVLDGSLQVSEHVVSNFHGHHVSLAQRVRKELLEGYLFYDWFSIPQVTAGQGVNEDATKTEMALAVSSISEYVESADLFIALVPFVQHCDTKEWCGYSSWIARGWCRAELWLHMLSSISEETSVVMINSTTEVKFMCPYDWLQNSVSEGQFTVEADRDVVVSLCEQALQNRLQELEFSGPLRAYRFYRAHEPSMLGQNYSHTGVQTFLDIFKFSTLREAALDQSSMTGLICAVFCADITMLHLLVGSKADVNMRLHGLGRMGYFDGQSLLIAAAKCSTRADVLAALIKLGADVNAPGPDGMLDGLTVKSPEHLQVLQSAGADLHSSRAPFGFTPLTVACGVAGSTPKTIKALLEARCDPNPPLLSAGTGPLHQAILYSRGQIAPLQTVRLLLDWRANPNTPAAPTGNFAAATEEALNKETLNGKHTSSYSNRSYAIVPGLTPLHAAAWVGDPDITQLLLNFRADVRTTNKRGDLPQDLAAESGSFQLLPLLSMSV